MSADEIANILKDIKEQGFPLEVRTSEILEAHDWEIRNQFGYLDHEEKKPKTVDILAKKNILHDVNRLVLDVHLVIECKRSTKPWVFYASDFDLNKQGISLRAVAASQFFIDPLAFKKRVHENFDEIMSSFLLKIHLKSPIFEKWAHIPFEPFSGGQVRDIHKARMQVCNTILDLMRGRFDIQQLTSPYGTILMPIIVFDGHLYTYRDEKLNAEKGLYYFFSYANSSFMIEVVTKDFFDEYLDIVDGQIKHLQTI